MTNNVSKTRRNPAVAVASELAAGNKVEITLSDGKRAIIKPVPASLIDEVTSRVKDPEVPMWHNDERDRDEPNPDNPVYLAGLEAAQRQRGIAAVDALCIFGIERLDPVSLDEPWYDKLMYMQKRGMVDLSGYDLDDPMDLDFVYKKFVGLDAGLISKITQMSINPEEIEAVARSFPGAA